MNLGALLGPPVQVAYAVDDAARAAAEWAVRWGAGPFTVRQHIPLTAVMYRGRPSTFDHTSAYGQWGSLMVELVEVHGPEENIVTERFARPQRGVHHLAFIVDDLDRACAALAEYGSFEAMRARTTSGVEFRFIDTVDTLGHFVELYRRSDALLRFYQSIAEAAVGWDGADPVRIAASPSTVHRR